MKFQRAEGNEKVTESSPSRCSITAADSLCLACCMRSRRKMTQMEPYPIFLSMILVTEPPLAPLQRLRVACEIL
jgi:hypothetical protein